MIYVILVAFVVFVLALQIIDFNHTTYHAATGNSFFATVLDKGRNGEYRIYKHLRQLEKHGAKFLFNVYLPKENGETTECDVILINHRGLIVFESKNYSGWIFGDEKSKTWMQTLPQGKGQPAHKERFLNPIMQNKLHIKCLQACVGSNYAVQSIIAFSERCTLKKVTVNDPNVQVVKRDEIQTAVTNATKRMPPNALTDADIQRLYKRLYPYSQVNETVKQQHIQRIKENQAKNKQ